MDQIPFDKIILGSPTLSPAVKVVLIENTEKLSEENKKILTDALFEYEQSVQVGAESFLLSLGQSAPMAE